MFMTWPQMNAAWGHWHQLKEDGVEINRTEERGFDAVVRNIEFRPDKPDGREYRLEPRIMEMAEDPGTDFEEEFNPFEVNRPPLPLTEVLANLRALHRDCNGRHVCDIPAQFASFDPKWFDLGTWADLVSAHKKHVASGIRNRTNRNGRAQQDSRQAGLPHPEDGFAWKMRSNRQIKRREARRRRG